MTPLKKSRNHKRDKERLKKRQKPAAKVVGDGFWEEGSREACRGQMQMQRLQIRMIIPTPQPDLNLSTPKWGP
jgi:hypothetical protein